MADLANPAAGGDAPAHKSKPEKPDDEKYKTELIKLEKEHSEKHEKLVSDSDITDRDGAAILAGRCFAVNFWADTGYNQNAIKNKISTAGPINKDSPTAKKQQELRSELSTIRQQQQGFKSSRTSQQEKISSLENSLRSKIADSKNSRGKVSFKSAEEIDREISRLEKQVDTGTMKLVDEKKALSEVSSLRKQRKLFAAFDEQQKGIDDLKTQISEMKKEKENPEEKALRERYTAIQQQLDDIKLEHDEAFKSLNSLRDEQTSLHADQQAAYAAIRAHKDSYFKAKREYKDYEDAAWKARKERQKAEREAFEKEKRRKIADKKMEEAQNPAYTDEIMSAEGLIRYFDPSSAAAITASEPGKFAAQAQRTVDDSEFKGMKMVKKGDREDDYFMGTGGKKGKKGRKGGAVPSSSVPQEGGKFNLSIDVIEQLGKVGIEPPMSQSDIPPDVEKLKTKLENWKKDQKRQTDEVGGSSLGKQAAC